MRACVRAWWSALEETGLSLESLHATHPTAAGPLLLLTLATLLALLLLPPLRSSRCFSLMDSPSAGVGPGGELALSRPPLPSPPPPLLQTAALGRECMQHGWWPTPPKSRRSCGLVGAEGGWRTHARLRIRPLANRERSIQRGGC